MNDNMYDCIITGGGAAGLMAAVTAADSGKSVLICEHNERLGRKLGITGKGRCNVTNNCTRDEFMANIPRNAKFLFSAYSQFSSDDCMAFFEGLGVPLKTERGNRVFPVSDKAADIVSALEKAAKERGVKIKHGSVTRILTENGCVSGVISGGTEIYAGNVVIATGGMSYPKTGSDGSGYKLAKMLGHTVTELNPSLVPLVTAEKYSTEMMGLSLKNVTLSLYDEKKHEKLYSELGEMLFTHFGVSGPLVLSASSHIRDMENGRYKLFIDLKPALDEKKLDARIVRDFTESPNKDFRNALGKLLPAKMIPVIVKLSGIAPDKQVNSVSREERTRLAELLKNFPMTVAGFRPIDEAIITSGGIKISEISPKTMGSKLVGGLYFAGEIIDVDAYTGGFNLQIAFSTGYAAGKAIGEKY